VTDVDPCGRYGPQSGHIERLVTNLRTMTQEQAEALAIVDAEALPAVTDVPLAVVEVAAGAAVAGTGWNAMAAAFAASEAVSRVTSGGVARGTAWGAALALATRHLVGRSGYTREQYEFLTRPVARILGYPLHPGDLI